MHNIFRIEEKTFPSGKTFTVVRFNIPRKARYSHHQGGTTTIGEGYQQLTSEFGHLSFGSLQLTDFTMRNKPGFGPSIFQFNPSSKKHPLADKLKGKYFRRVMRRDTSANPNIKTGSKWQWGDYRSQAWALEEVNVKDLTVRKDRMGYGAVVRLAMARGKTLTEAQEIGDKVAAAMRAQSL